MAILWNNWLEQQSGRLEARVALLISATLNNLNKQCVCHHPHTMALPSGIYTIKNVKYRNWAMLLNANEGEVVAGSSTRVNVGEKVRTSEIWFQQRSLTNPSSGASIYLQTRLILFRINSTTVIMQLTPLLILHRTRQQFPAYGTLHWRPCNGGSIPPMLKEVICASFCKSPNDDYLSRLSSGYLIWMATAIGVYQAPILKPRYWCTLWYSSNWKLRHKYTSGWARRIRTQWPPTMEFHTGGCRDWGQLACWYAYSICFSH